MRPYPGRYILFIFLGSTVLVFAQFWSHVTDFTSMYSYRNWMFSNLSDREASSDNSTRNTTYCVPQSKTTCTTVNYYELYNRSSHVNNVTLYVTPNNIWIGRLGNQMFIYASILGIARAQGRQMFIAPKSALEGTFKITHIAVNERKKRWPMVKQQEHFDAKLMNLSLQHVKIDGYLQSFWYFAAVMDEVRQEFTFHDSIANNAAKIIHKVYLKYNSSMIVGVHVRRGDYLEENFKQLGYGVPEKSYFKKAFRLMKSKFPGRKMIFLVASDDLRWCSKNLLGDDVYIIPPASAAVHLAVLSKCDHMIITGGTYGWWSGWLANGYVIYYTGHMQKWTPFGWDMDHYKYYPRMWIGLGN